jgi:hypothetical protein
MRDEFVCIHSICKIMEEKIVAQVPKDLLGTEFSKDAEGRVYHVGAKRGESSLGWRKNPRFSSFLLPHPILVHISFILCYIYVTLLALKHESSVALIFVC